jgi:metal-responsive CopG/Arc/MetJ family transcriptional regulator
MKKLNETRITIRFPSDLVKAVKTLAIQHDRSLNSEVVHAVRVYIAQQRGENRREKSL